MALEAKCGRGRGKSRNVRPDGRIAVGDVRRETRPAAVATPTTLPGRLPVDKRGAAYNGSLIGIEISSRILSISGRKFQAS
jgi:hypothetical protein